VAVIHLLDVALAVLFDLSRELNRAKEHNPDQAPGLVAALRQLGGVPGVLQAEPEVFLRKGAPSAVSQQVVLPYDLGSIEELMARRAQARLRKDWAEADPIRSELKSQGVVLEDRPDGTTEWRRE
jgi:cysteinyl-tRNA synthetase